MADNVHQLRPKAPDTEKITINLGYVDLGHVDLMVQEGFYSNRTDFIRTAIRNQLERHADVVKQSTARNGKNHDQSRLCRPWSRRSHGSGRVLFEPYRFHPHRDQEPARTSRRRRQTVNGPKRKKSRSISVMSTLVTSISWFRK